MGPRPRTHFSSTQTSERVRKGPATTPSGASWIRRYVLAVLLGAFSGAGLYPCVPLAQEANSYVGGVPTLDQALQSDDPVRIKLAVVAAIARSPRATDAIIRHAVAAKPELRGEILSAAKEAYPEFAETIDKAADLAEPEDPVDRPSVDGVPNVPTPTDTPESKWSGEIEFGGTRATGNSRNRKANVAIDIQNKRVDWLHKLSVNYDFASDKSRISESRMVIEAETNYNVTERLFYFGRVEYRDDRFSGFDYVVTETAGIGYYLRKGEPLEITVDIGPGFEQRKRSDTGETLDDIQGRFRMNLKLTLSERVELTDEFQYAIGSERTETKNVTALTSKILGNLFGRFSFEVRQNSSPPPGTSQTDTLSKASLVYRF